MNVKSEVCGEQLERRNVKELSLNRIRLGVVIKLSSKRALGLGE